MAESSATCRIVLATMGATDMRWILGAAIVIATSLPVALGSAVTSDAMEPECPAGISITLLGHTPDGGRIEQWTCK